jgi:hypothetical protein
MFAVYVRLWPTLSIWVGQKRVCTPYMTVYYVISLPKIPYIRCLCTALANVKHMGWPEACMCAVYDRILSYFSAKLRYAHHINMALATLVKNEQK